MVDTSFNPGFQTKPSIEAETADRFNIVLKKTTAVTTACRIRYQLCRFGVPITVDYAQISADEMAVTDEEPNRAATLYLGMDGTGIPMRATETAGRKGKPKAGDPAPQAKTREVKLATVWSAGRFDDRGVALTDPGSVSYNAAIESAHTGPKALAISAFGKRVEREANRRQFYQAKRQVAIGDGALWIWNTCGELFPDAIQIVDLFHTKEKIATVAKTIFGEHRGLVRP